MFNMLPLVSSDFGATLYYCNKVFLLFQFVKMKHFSLICILAINKTSYL